MASELPTEPAAAYSAIIDQILASSDLNTISAKRIRKGLQEKVEVDLTPQKAAITDLIMERFDKVQREQPQPTAAPEPAPSPTTNGHVPINSEPPPEPAAPSPSPVSPAKRKAESSDDDLSEPASSPPPKKAAKKSKPKPKSEAETDEQLAKRMQAELNAQTTGRSTRGGGSGGSTKKKGVAKPKSKTPVKKKQKSKAKLNSDDDSEIEHDSDSKKAAKPDQPKKGGFHKLMALSAPLSALLEGETALSRPQTVKRIWAYVKERDLQDPADKRQIRCDDAMKAVFKQDKVHMFTMNKLLAGHLYAVDETV